ncbi:MAG: heparinase II/III family protein [Micavibrio aeruginosavorus]|nr:heparinase II/III family protein [Micavibrio aeruginosavorus]
MTLKLISDIRHKATAAAYGTAFYQWTLGGSLPERLAVIPPDPWPGDAANGRMMCHDVFTFQGEQLPSPGGDFEPSGATPAWLAHIHSFEWLRDLRALGGDTGRRQARAMVMAWIDRYGMWHENAWRPDLTGRRVAMWIALHDFFAASADDVFQTNYLTVLLRQARHLSRAVPGTLGGMGLLHALRGLAYAGLAFEGREQWLEQSLTLLAHETKKQILSDGGHVSRNPAQVLEAMRLYIDLRSALQAAQYPVPEFIQHAIDRMAQAMRFLRTADRGFALFNGAQEGDRTLMDMVQMIANAHGRVLRSLPETGYERLSIGRSLLIVDTGRAPVWPHDEQAHAAPLAFEFSYGKERIFTNCGTHPTDPHWQDALRGTAAHNTAGIDHKNACEIRKDGHFGRRTRNVVVTREDVQGAGLIDSVHDGYVPMSGISHRRRLYLSDQGHDLRGEETLTCSVGLSKAVDVTLRFHLHPRVLVSLVRGKKDALLRLPGGSGWRFTPAGGLLSLENSVYLGEGGRPRKTKQIVLSASMDRDLCQLKWALQREG